MEKTIQNFFSKLKRTEEKTNLFYFLNYAFLGIIIISLVVNQFAIINIHEKMGIKSGLFQFIKLNKKMTGHAMEDAVSIVFAKGMPDIYGQEMGVTFENVQDSMVIMKQYDPTYGPKKIVLSEAEMKRYINIGLKISCEYCCGAKSIISENGEAACGCDHSKAMRGLAAYLIRNHAGQYSDDEILRELARWKGVYFPKQMTQKLAGQLQNGNFTPDTAALIMGMKLPKYGTASVNAPLPSEINNLPSMVGGC